LRTPSEHEDRIVEVSPGALAPNPCQIRAIDASDLSLKELAESIQKMGLIEPPIIRPTSRGYEIATGHRRVFCCHRMLGLERIRCIVRCLTDEQMAEVVVEENLKRQSLNPIEEAKGYANLRDRFNWSEEKIAARFSRTRDIVAQRLRLLTFQRPIQDAVAQGLLTVSHAEAIATAPVPKQEQLAKAVMNGKLSVKETTQMAKDLVDRENANKEALENIASRLESFDTQLSGLHQRTTMLEPVIALILLHRHEWKANNCVHNINGFCNAFAWKKRPSYWAKKLQRAARFSKQTDGNWHVQACGTVCAFCSVYQRGVTTPSQRDAFEY